MSTDKTFFGHPRGLATLFFTEMWERFSYYGMRALLLLFMVASVEKGGMGLDDKTGGAIYGLYTMFVYLLALPGGWLADKFFGLRKSIFYGGCIIALGHFCLAFPSQETFFVGLLFIVIGTGLLKPNISSMVGEIYPPEDQVRRDAGFSIFFMGINSGALVSPIIVGYLGQNVNWHYGFAAAGVGMILGVIQYKLTENYLGTVGLEPARHADPVQQKAQERNIRYALWIIGLGLVALVVLLWTRAITINPVAFAQGSGVVLLISVLLYFIYVFIFEKLSADEKKKVLAIFIFFVVTTAFYAGYEGQGSSLNLFADRYTDRLFGSFNMPASWLQSAPPIFVILFVPVFTWLWSTLAKHKLNPITPVKLALGLFWMGLGYLVMMGAAEIVMNGNKPGISWLVITYMLHTFGEICLYPIGLSGVTKLAPKRLVGQMMGVFFMALALGNLFAGLYAGEFSEDVLAKNPSLMIDLFALIVKIMFVAGVIVLVFAKPIRKLMGNIR
ncbi:peptide MFS transporter [Parachryseolinea silvisoli]|uniref:peptide MFS transporter n=1 Tax=Parachryseolinea silvisoli TaxID=2873601 RepID=UPI002265B252|nr:peptide MFS transporter [Parachryseolinea silvisoli]MCD9019746.1 peptide MFS transporter [Parachryseolinea silvisoli]